MMVLYPFDSNTCLLQPGMYMDQKETYSRILKNIINCNDFAKNRNMLSMSQIQMLFVMTVEII